MKYKVFAVFIGAIISLSFFLYYSLDNTKPISKPQKSTFTPKALPPGSENVYHLTLKMDKEETFSTDTQIDIKNVSSEQWDELVLYFIPNMFTKENSPSLANPASIKIKSLKINGKPAKYILEKDTLTIPLLTNINPNQSVEFQMSYDFTLPENGLRFTKTDSNLYLAQWYPIVPTYRNGWNKEEYRFKGETYHTSFSDYYLELDVPHNFTIVTTSESDEHLSNHKNKVYIKDSKDLFISLLNNPLMNKASVDGVEIRLFNTGKYAEEQMALLDISEKAFEYFEEHIGPYPTSQLDIIVGEMGMEYPGVVTAGSIYGSGTVKLEQLKKMIVHEIAHQWFYGVINNDPYNDAWLDEGVTEVATVLFFSKYQDKDLPFKVGINQTKELPLPVNLPLNKYTEQQMSSYIYGKSASNLGYLFESNGGIGKAEDFFKQYYFHYRYKEINTEEFVRFTKHFFKLKNNAKFKGWIDLEMEP